MWKNLSPFVVLCGSPADRFTRRSRHPRCRGDNPTRQHRRNVSETIQLMRPGVPNHPNRPRVWGSSRCRISAPAVEPRRRAL